MTRGRRRRGISAFAAGVIGIVVIVVFTYLAFTQFANPFANPFTVHATFSSAGGLRPGSLVRIAGVNIGKVTGIDQVPGCGHDQPGRASCSATEVTMTIDDQGLPLHTDATFAIRPRTFLEGNFFIDVSPGTPDAPRASDGHTFPVQQGIQAVQLDQILTSLQADTRRNLQTLLQQYGTAVKRGGPAYNRSIPVLAARLPLQLGRRPRRARDRTARPLELDRRLRDGRRRAQRQPPGPRQPRHGLQHDRRRVRAPERRAAGRAGRAAPNAVGGDPGVQRAQRVAAAADHARRRAAARRPIGRARDRRDAAAGRLSCAGWSAPDELGALASTLQRAAPALSQLTRGTIPLMAGRRTPGVQLPGHGHLPVVAADAEGSALQRLQRVPAPQGLRRGGRLPPRPGRRVAQLRR